ncbi:hypothetical protein [Cognatishimia activa]|uniref:hypothetical protein n=1 Tax=Cognatishimia activa TaxID=1715691 RepID=UPI0006F0C5FB|nr:hypothetical protein [Cognatishimia activa]CUJ30399.1 hypothetical protein TA5113_02958 [Cognatishimia activa]
MAYIKDEIEIPAMKKLQGWLFGIGGVSGLITFGAYQNGSVKGMLIYGSICIVLFFIGAKLKTTKKLQRTVSQYR